MTAMLRLYTYYRSSAAFRVRIALNYKGLAYQAIPVHLLRDGGEQHSEAFGARNPARLVPVLQDGALSITMKVEVLEDGAPGQIIRARNPISRRDVSGKVLNEQTILITL